MPTSKKRKAQSEEDPPVTKKKKKKPKKVESEQEEEEEQEQEEEPSPAPPKKKKKVASSDDEDADPSAPLVSSKAMRDKLKKMRKKKNQKEPTAKFRTTIIEKEAQKLGKYEAEFLSSGAKTDLEEEKKVQKKEKEEMAAYEIERKRKREGLEKKIGDWQKNRDLEEERAPPPQLDHRVIEMGKTRKGSQKKLKNKPPSGKKFKEDEESSSVAHEVGVKQPDEDLPMYSSDPPVDPNSLSKKERKKLKKAEAKKPKPKLVKTV